MLPLTQSLALLAVPLIGGALGRLIASELVRRHQTPETKAAAPSPALDAKSSETVKSRRQLRKEELQAQGQQSPSKQATVIVDLTLLSGREDEVRVHTELDYPVSDVDIRTALDSLKKQAPA